MILNDHQFIFVAVRLKSKRLERKALLDLAGRPLIIRLFERLNQFIPAERIVLCTSTNPQDSAVFELAMDQGIKVFRGSELDVAERFLNAADAYGAKTIVRVTGDNPLTDAEFILEMLKSHADVGAEYTYVNDLPVGTRAEVIEVSALRRIRKEWTNPDNSEYMTLFLNRGDKVKQNGIYSNNPTISRPEIRLTVDTPEDFSLMQSIYQYFNGTPPKLDEIIKFLDNNPDLIIVENSSTASKLPAEIDVSYIGD